MQAASGSRPDGPARLSPYAQRVVAGALRAFGKAAGANHPLIERKGRERGEVRARRAARGFDVISDKSRNPVGDVERRSARGPSASLGISWLCCPDKSSASQPMPSAE
jgi:hypothetical protein